MDIDTMALIREQNNMNPLLSLPTELKMLILDQTTTRQDYDNIALTCHDLELITRPVRYQNLSLRVADGDEMATTLMTPANLPVDAANWVKKLNVQPINTKDQSGDGQGPVEVSSFDHILCDLLSRIPRNRLLSFNHTLRSSISQQVFQAVFDYHSGSITELRLYKPQEWCSEMHSIPRQLSKLHINHVTNGHDVGSLVFWNQNTIQSLRLGSEDAFMNQSSHSRINLSDQPFRTLQDFNNNVKLADLLDLEDLAFTAMNLHPLVGDMVSDMSMPYHRIRRLALESCVGSTEFLTSLAHSFSSASQDKPVELKEFVFRHESVTSELKEALVVFLASFSGLETLTVLLENTTFSNSAEHLIGRHGPTLKRLALECRTSTRLTLTHDTSRPFGFGDYSHVLWESTVNDITRLCPNLEQLGVGFPWDDEMVRIRGCVLPTLKSLRTMHVRNFPQSNQHSQFGQYEIKACATKFLDWTFASYVGDEPPSLDLISIGPTVYETRSGLIENSNSNNTTIYGNRKNLPEFAQTHHLAVDWAKTRFGKWIPLVTNISERYVEDLYGENPLQGIYQAIWIK